MKSEWSDKISSSSLSTLDGNKSNEELIPLTSDLKILKQFAEKRMTELGNELRKKPSPQAWLELAQLTAMRVITFNKRRSGEASSYY
jgi:hypothetical protein